MFIDVVDVDVVNHFAYAFQLIKIIVERTLVQGSLLYNKSVLQKPYS